MPLQPWVRNITPLAWLLATSAFANVITAVALVYLALGTPNVHVNGYVTANVSNAVEIQDRYPIHVVVMPR